jgi:hypothetical protein
MTSRKTVVIPLIVGLIGFVTLTRTPRFEAFHAVDVLQLLASGMCFGVALMAALGRLRPRFKD